MTQQSLTESREVAELQNRGPTDEDGRSPWIRDRIHRSLVDWVGEEGIRPHHVLAAGSGTGALLRRVAIRFPDAELRGVDICERLPGDYERLPFADESFDLVVSVIGFQHWRSRPEGLSEIRRVLRPGGRVFVADHYAAGSLRPFFAVPRCLDGVHTLEELQRMYGAAGLSVDRWKLLDRLADLPLIHGIGAVKP